MREIAPSVLFVVTWRLPIAALESAIGRGLFFVVLSGMVLRAQPADGTEPADVPRTVAFDVRADVAHRELHPDFCWFHPRVAALPGWGKDGQPAVVMTIQKHLAVRDSRGPVSPRLVRC